MKLALMPHCGWMALLLLAGCSHSPHKSSTAVLDIKMPGHFYCARYFIYDMCVLDLDQDGTTDAMYFDDSKEIFMYDPSLHANLSNKLVMHPCVQQMDAPMKAASTGLLKINGDTPILQKLGLQKEMLSQYSRYSSQVNKCKKALAKAAPAEDAFGDDLDF